MSTSAITLMIERRECAEKSWLNIEGWFGFCKNAMAGTPSLKKIAKGNYFIAQLNK
jgi:hypothetical protein